MASVSLDEGDISNTHYLTDVDIQPNYTPLDRARFEIRLLAIEPPQAQATDPIQCRLVVVSLIDRPEYHALSYHWGDQKDLRPVQLDSAITYITHNLETALRELRRRGILLVWADALSINQSDLYEKAAQIQLMGQIYSRAIACIAWLGASTSTSHDAIIALDKVCNDAFTKAKRRSGRKSSGASYDEVQELHREHDSQRQAVAALLARPYWTRKWILQEIVKAKVVQVWCGPDELSLDQVCYVAGGLSWLDPSPGFPQILSLLRVVEQQATSGTPRMTLASALLSTRTSLATDSRDAIFALLGLTCDGSDLVPMPNYVEPVEDIFVRTSWNMMKGQGQIALLLLARRSRRCSLPSWVPDWSSLAEPLPTWVSAGAGQTKVEGHRASTSQDVAGPQIRIRGVILAPIKRLEGGRQPTPRSRVTSRVDAIDVLGSLYSVLMCCPSLLPFSADQDVQRVASSSAIFSRAYPALSQPTERSKAEVIAGAIVSCVRSSETDCKPFSKIKAMVFAGQTIEQWTEQYESDLAVYQPEQPPKSPVKDRVKELGIRALLRVGQNKEQRAQFQRSIAIIEANMPSQQSLQNARRKEIEHHLNAKAEGNMRLAVAGDPSTFEVVYEKAQPGDLICLLDGCPLRVVLRATAGKQYEYIGEVCGDHASFADHVAKAEDVAVENIVLV
ncbi:hypothetical protein LTR56_015633 [Elasticomyces elasticus]|nr:hypothetical protein LTR22_025224 [Elasticomyces elasticus]KAK3633719.1 hypothetical protein LTR56_015633 [Elasticomyces elasticus]KAK4914518.1 hypothetical protein LTR49_017211 [Elasticomyces elasticus]KAK5754343.1 hypothetical protein LTS12_015521 [Elasticomyces elasticus]